MPLVAVIRVATNEMGSASRTDHRTIRRLAVRCRDMAETRFVSAHREDPKLPWDEHTMACIEMSVYVIR